MVKNLPGMWKIWVQSLGPEDPLEEGMATHSSILAWENPMDRGAQRGAHRGRRERYGVTQESAHLRPVGLEGV